ncbi:restriction endonuclease subunit S [Paracoccus sp. (in: a-proteobacteria)]|uniref:restriction endonuclease subunit S n=1 Tax=Paracoccus sp. TaxID=267 RepID=UPI00289663A4|nr:restriction endonuclease subunit S [Paracoccus sp. (in: a-proteobacteria)]
MSARPRGWIAVEIGDVTKIVTGKTPAKSESTFYESGNIPFFKPGDLTNGGVIAVSEDNVTERAFATTTQLPAGTVLVSCIGILGKSAIIAKLGTCNQQINAILPSDVAVSGFIYHWSRTIRSWLNENSSATTVAIINKKRFSAAPILLPPLAEQKRIVAKLDTLNAKSARARTELARIETLVSRYKQAVLSKAFSGELTGEWRIQKRVKEPSIGKLDELLSVPVRNGLSVKGSDTPPGFPALKLSALRARDVNLDDVRYIPVDDLKASRFLLEAGDILVSRGNGTRSLVGIASLVPPLARRTIFPDTAFRIRVDVAKALPLWLSSIWNAPQVRSQIELIAKTTAGIWKISQKDLATIQLNLPSNIEEQHEITRRIESAFAKIDRLAAEAKRALALVGKLDEAILAKAFRGELVPQDENDEPAEQLLERIRAELQTAPKIKRGRKAKA